MSNTRVKIINPLALPTPHNDTQPVVDPYSLRQNYSTPTQQVYNDSKSNRLVLEPLPSSTLVKNDLPGTSSTVVSERLEFPLSALDLYTTLLQESEHGSTSNNDTIDSTPHKYPLIATGHDGSSSSTCRSHEGPLDSSNFDSYLPLDSGKSFSKQLTLGLDGFNYHQESRKASSEEQASISIPNLESNLDNTADALEPPVDFESKRGASEKDKILDSRCVDQFQETIDSLPDVVENVSQAQKHQLVEVARQRQILQQVKELFSKEKDNLEELVAELNTCKRKICVAEDQSTQLQKQCKQLGKDITDTMNADFDIQWLTRAEGETLTENKRLYEQYRSKMTHHREAVTEVEGDMGVNVEVKRQQEMIAVLQAEKIAIECKLKEGTNQSSRLQQDIKVLAAEKNALEAESTNIEKKIRSECDQHAAINQDIEVLHKRNQAQMTRLKKQIKEGHLRNRQWNMEACQLERNLEELRKSMEE